MRNDVSRLWVLVVAFAVVMASPIHAKGVDEEDLDDEGRGIIENYEEMVEGDGINWIWIAPGVTLSDYRIDVGGFENLSDENDDDMEEALNDGFQEGFGKLSRRDNRKGTLTTQNAIHWAEEASEGKRWIPFAGQHLAQAGVGIEMIFRNSSGEIVAMVRHSGREGNDLEDAAEELVDDLVDWVNDN